jgi:ribokinase
MYDVITLGSGTVDVFVKTHKPEIVRHNQHEDVCYAIGEKILVDDLHVETGGGGTNTAVAFARLGMNVGWVGKVGSDLHANTILAEMKRERVAFLGSSDKGNADRGRRASADAVGRNMSGYSVILTGLEHDRTILAYKGANDRLVSADVPWKKLNTKWLYLSALMGKSFATLVKAAQFAQKNNIKYAFNPSTYLARQGLAKLKPVINGCDLLVLNREEAQAVLGTKDTCVQMLPALQKYAKIVVITDGPKTAHAYNGFEHYALQPPNFPVIETTGAGDAFAAGMLAGLAATKDIATAMQWGMAESGSVIQHIGAKHNLLSRKGIDRWVKTKAAKITVTRM